MKIVKILAAFVGVIIAQIATVFHARFAPWGLGQCQVGLNQAVDF